MTKKRRLKFNSLGLQLTLSTNPKRKRFTFSRESLEDLTDETLFYLKHLERLGFYDENISKHRRTRRAKN